MKDIMIPDNADDLTLKEVCERCVVSAQKVITLVEYGVVEPEGGQFSEWRFSSASYLRLKKALRIQRDLEVNEPGVALAIDLLDRLEQAKQEIEHLEKRVRYREES
ncbi:MAG: chaperone modulator CbpM [Porticoccaceae bacterium]|nr:chaperone modulator CbpM [Pseudomonadales bacterium]MCP5171926.1 chaperone modulator CbpM [Pseudomonadales bacterium]